MEARLGRLRGGSVASYQCSCLRVPAKIICGRSCHFLLNSFISNDLASILSPEGFVMLLFSIIISNCEDCFLFMLINLTGVLCPLLKFFSSYQVLHLFSTGVLSEIFLTPCAILLIVPEAVCCWFRQVSSHLVKFMFNSFHLQSECCPNYIILIPSLSWF